MYVYIYTYIYTYTGWWFGTFLIFPYIGNNYPNWLIFSRGVQTTKQYIMYIYIHIIIYTHNIIYIYILHIIYIYVYKTDDRSTLAAGVPQVRFLRTMKSFSRDLLQRDDLMELEAWEIRHEGRVLIFWATNQVIFISGLWCWKHIIFFFMFFFFLNGM